MKSRNAGFTVIEVVIIIVLAGLLFAMAIPAFKKMRDNEKGKTQSKILVITNPGRFVVESPIVGSMSVVDNKVRWVDDKGVIREYALAQGHSIESR